MSERPTALLDNDAQPRTLTITLPNPVLRASYPVRLVIKQDGQMHTVDGRYRVEFMADDPPPPRKRARPTYS